MSLTSCPRCHGDIWYDQPEDEYVCINCGRRFARITRIPLSLESELAERREAANGHYGRKSGRKYGPKRARQPSINGIRI